MNAKVSKFEELVVWQMGREITKEIYGITSIIGQRDFGFCDQVRRASVSIMNNVAEGYERGSNKDFAKFLFIARGSCGEVRSMLYVALDQRYVGQEDFDRVGAQCRQCSAAIWGLIKSLSRNSSWTERAQIVGTILLFTLFPTLSRPVTL